MTSNLSGERRKKETHQPTEQNMIRDLEINLIVLWGINKEFLWKLYIHTKYSVWLSYSSSQLISWFGIILIIIFIMFYNIFEYILS